MQSDSYKIADEPSGGLTQYCVSPMLLLLIAIFIPKPYQLLMPLVFLLNAWLMGAYNFKQQAITAVAGYAIIFGAATLASSIVYGMALPFDNAAVGPYIRMLLNAAFFALLYRLLLLQNPTFELISYIRERRS